MAVHPVQTDANGGGANLPPQDLQAEGAVLGAIFFMPQALATIEIDVKLRSDDFYSGRNRLIFTAMRRLEDKAEPEAIDHVTVTRELERMDELEPAGGATYVQSLGAAAPSAGHFKSYAKIVKDLSKRRRLLLAAREIQDNVFGFGGDTIELLENSESKLFKIGQEDQSGELRSIGDVLDTELDKLEKISREGIGLTGTPTGFQDLNDLTGGLQPGNLIVLAARPAMGKSALAVNIAANAAMKHGAPVALFSLEMSEAELAQRFIAVEARENGDNLRKGRVAKDRWPRIIKATEKLAAAPLYVDDSSDLGIHELRAKTRRLHSREHLGLVIVDYLQLMRPEDSRVSRVEQIGQISRGLKILARELNIPVIAVSQLSRAVESRNPPVPMLSDLRESGQIEQDADLVMFIYRHHYYNHDDVESEGKADLIVAKHRNGPVGDVKLAFMARYPRFTDLMDGPLAESAPPSAEF